MKKSILNKWSIFGTLFLLVLLLTKIKITGLAGAQEKRETIYIQTALELVELSEQCRYDNWTKGKTVILKNDISLKGVDFEPIPYFQGVFDGQGYTISDLELADNYSPTGLFGTVGKDAVIRNLTLLGTVIPGGDENRVGGLVGVNQGKIVNCCFSGVVSGENQVGGLVGVNTETGIVEKSVAKGNILGKYATGGIVGKNLGHILECTNHAYVNNTSGDGELGITNIKVNPLLDLYALNSSDLTNTATDTGGIAGYSVGIIGECMNKQTVGYSKVGFNVGGIVGRSSGYLYDNINYGEVLGRKDVGGIVGQAEPFVLVNTYTSQLAILEGQFQVLEGKLELLTGDMKNMGTNIRESMDLLDSYMTQARKAADSLRQLLKEENQKFAVNSEQLEDTLIKTDKKMTEIEKGLEQLETYLDALSSIINGMESRTMKEGENLAGNLKKMEKLFGNLQIKIENSVAENLTDLEGLNDAVERLEDLTDVIDRLEGLQGKVDSFGKEIQPIFAVLTDVLDSTGNYLNYMFDNMKELSDYRSKIESETRRINTNLKEINQYLDELDVFGKINEFQNFHAKITSNIEDLSEIMDAVANGVDVLTFHVSSGTDKITKDLDEVEIQLHLITDTIKKVLAESEEQDDIITVKVTKEDVETMTYGKITGSANYALVEGENSVGGIVGAMSMELESDPEDEHLKELSWREKQEYQLKTIVCQCTNKGDVVAKKNTVGGICGQMDVGLISDCYAYGTITSETGDYTGGIAGILRATITDCVSNCVLSGNYYVGGIIGCGYSGEKGASEVANCYSMVRITDCKQYEGAIAGDNRGNFTNNFFVSNVLRGINRISYENKAEEISYTELLKVNKIPRELTTFTLSFVADGKVIKEIDFSYGDSFGPEVFPQIPKKEGYSGTWDTTDLSNLYFDTVVTAEYTLYVTALKTEASRENGRPVFLITGNFEDEDGAEAVKQTITNEMITEFETQGNLTEYWKVGFNEDGGKRHGVRFLPMEEQRNTRIYIKNNGAWELADTQSFGSYTTFQVTGNEFEMAVVTYGREILVTILFVVITILVVIGMIVVMRKSKILSKLSGKITKKVRKKYMIVLLVVLSILLGIGAIIYISRLPQFTISKELLEISDDILTAEKQSFKLELNARIGETRVDLDSQMHVMKENGTRVWVLEENGHSLYWYGDAVFLENGKAYRVAESKTNDHRLFEQMIQLFRMTDITRKQETGSVIYSITTKGDKAETLMEALIPFSEGQIVSVKKVVVDIITKEGVMQKVQISGEAKLKNSMETEMEVFATFSEFDNTDHYELPQDIKTAMKNTPIESLTFIGEHMYRLLFAWIEFDGKEQEGEVAIDVSCGPVNVEMQYDWQELCEKTQNFANVSETNLTRLPQMLYEICMNGESACERIGNSYIFTLEIDAENMALLAKKIMPEIGKQLVEFQQGILEVVVKNNEISSLDIKINGQVTLLYSKIDAYVKAEFEFGKK